MRINVNSKSALYGLLLFFVGIVNYLFLQPVSKALAGNSFLAPPYWFAPDIHPLKVGQPGSFMGMSITGVYWVPIVYLVGWFLNIAGEELLFRGYLIPRMELWFASKAWRINAICW